MNRSIARRIVLSLGTSLVVLTLAACTAEPGSVAAPAPTENAAAPRAAEQIELAPKDSPKPLDLDCGTLHSTIDYATQSVEAFSRESTHVLVGEVVEVGPAQWNTKDGEPPLQDDLDFNSMIRLVRVHPSEQVKGESPAGELVVSVPGGTIGCHTMWGVTPELKPGDQFLFFLGGPALQADLPEVEPVLAQWPVDEKGQIETPEDGQLSVDQVETLVTEAN